jgi:GH24 family phage-related lysozyme (muramidase)
MQLTPRAVAYLASEEGLCLEAYLDSDTPPNWTWALGLTDAAGIKIKAYVNRPASVETCLRASIDHLTAHYLPAVNTAFAGHALNEAQLAAALSFHWNTGAIGHAGWVAAWKSGQVADARKTLTTHYINNGQLTARRLREAELFFDSKWPSDLRCPIRQVSKPGYHPYKPQPTDLMPMLQQIMGGH